MKVLNELSVKDLRLNKKRSIVIIIGIILSTALICGVAGLITSFQKTFVETAKNSQGNYHAIFYNVPKDELKYIEENRSIEDYYLSEELGYSYLSNGNTSTEEEETFGLKDLKIDGLELTPEFKTDVYEYSAELKEDKTSLELTTIATEENAEIEVTGNEDLKDGENIITVIVKEKDTDKTATYQITVNKIKEETNITEATVNNIDNKTKEMIILGIGILALIIVVIIIVIVNKKRNSNNGQEYYYSELYNNDESEENINEENQDEQEEYDEEIEEKKKKKHSKGKRFK